MIGFAGLLAPRRPLRGLRGYGELMKAHKKVYRSYPFHDSRKEDAVSYKGEEDVEKK